jgi:8-oxo-dGTP diphosphatase
MILVRAAGGLLWRAGKRGPELAVVHRPKRDDWSLPKGKLEDGEGFREAALREVEEETGIEARVVGYAGFTAYAVKGRPKVVLFWHMEPRGKPGRFRPNDEVDRLAWLPRAEALARLDHASERRLVIGARSPLEDGAPAKARAARRVRAAEVRARARRRGGPARRLRR